MKIYKATVFKKEAWTIVVAAESEEAAMQYLGTEVEWQQDGMVEAEARTYGVDSLQRINSPQECPEDPEDGVWGTGDFLTIAEAAVSESMGEYPVDGFGDDKQADAWFEREAALAEEYRLKWLTRSA